jgi:hypothetical protein
MHLLPFIPQPVFRQVADLEKKYGWAQRNKQKPHKEENKILLISIFKFNPPILTIKLYETTSIIVLSKKIKPKKMTLASL